MGILRTDRVSGLGGANAIKGSTKFDGDLGSNGNYLGIGDSDDFSLGSGDFTIEAWIYASALSTNNYEGIIGQWPQNNANANNSWVLEIVARDLEFYYCYDGANIGSVVQGGSVKENEWTHVMVTRSGNTMYRFVNGTAHNNSGQSVTHTFNDVTADVTIGGYIVNAAMWKGNISNVRIIKGRALHTSNFTVPTSELVKTSDTVLLACQSSADILKEATGKIITPRRTNSNSSYPTASRFTPNSPVGFSTTTDVGTQFGSTFDGVTTFDSQAYFVPPGGNTRERNRGRGVISGGRDNEAMQFINIQSQGNSQTFGDSITGDGIEGFAVGSSTRGLFSGGYPSVGNVIEFITFATTSNGTDFGDMTTGRRSGAGAGNETRGLFAGGLNSSGTSLNTIEFSTIATLGNSTDFGDLTQARDQFAGLADTTRGIFAGGVEQPGTQFNVIDFVTIATTGNAQDFGDMTGVNTGSSGSSDSTRGVIMVGNTSPAMLEDIDFVTIQSVGNAQDFGDLTLARYLSACMSNSTRAVFAGGGTPSATNTIDFVTIQTTGNANDFGDLIEGGNFVLVGTSDSHGGLS